MKIVIIEDELLAAQKLEMLIHQYDSTIEIVATLESIEETVHWFQTKPSPDLLMMDIHLSDGSCFEIFKHVSLNKPVIFTTAYDEYALNAFSHFGIDYLLKPISAETLAASLNKFKTITTTFAMPDYQQWSSQLNKQPVRTFKERFLAKIGSRSFFIETGNIAYFSADNKIVYLHDMDGNKFIINYTMEKLESILDPHLFFRINRKYIIHSRIINQVKPHFNNRLKLLFKNIMPDEEILVSRERVPAFREWAEG